MNYNILSYAIYAVITIYIIVWVGKMFHRNGRIFILSLFKNQTEMADTTNNLLLVAYYLFNIGYTIVQLSYWKHIPDIASTLSSVGQKSGILILMLAALHYNNMFIIYLLSKNKMKSIHL